MAKKKIKSMPAAGSDEEVETTTVDISEKMAKELKIGQKITVTITGEIGMINTPPEADMGEPYIGIRVLEKKVEPENAFAKLSNDDDGED